MRSILIQAAYNLAFIVILTAMLPWLLARLLRRGQWKSGFTQRFGLFTEDLQHQFQQNPPIWLHAVSVGEANLVVRLVNALQTTLPQCRFVVSTTTTTGMAQLQKQLPSSITKIYYPLDFLPWVKKSLRTVQPKAVILVEAEIWPNFLWTTRSLQIPALLVNARVSEKSQRRYTRLKSLFHPLFAQFKLVCCSTHTDAQRLLSLGCPTTSIQTVGNLKFDVELPPSPHPDPAATQLLLQAGIKPESHLILLGGSTHAGEEKILGECLKSLRPSFPNLVLVVAPRHFERAGDACHDLQQLGLQVTRRSSLQANATLNPPPDALVVDSTGELKSLYSCATVVFIGKSLTAHGGQNPVEPAALAKPIITGPHMQNFQLITREFLAHQAITQVQNPEQLLHQIQYLLENPEACQRLGENARQVVQTSSGATKRTLNAILQTLASAP
ncbi:MAG: 3-deoxy-D-manno-octulosonic acid transferase [Limisphaerales bacterium]